MTMMRDPRPARDGETLSDERAILSDDQVELIREEARSTATAEGFMLAHGSPTAHDILLLCDSHAALRAELALRDGMIDSLRADVAREAAQGRALRAELADASADAERSDALHRRRYENIATALGRRYPTAEEIVAAAITFIDMTGERAGDRIFAQTRGSPRASRRTSRNRSPRRLPGLRNIALQRA